MFTIIYVYCIIYIVSLCFIFFFYTTNNLTSNFSKISLSQSISFINNYHNDGWLLKFFILQLSGLPPFFIFFLKLHYLLLVLKHLGLVITILFFLNVLFSMFYYLKLFMVPSLKITNNLLKLNTVCLLTNVKNKQANKKYFFMILSFIFLFFNCLSFIFLIDFIFTITNFFI